MTPEHQKIVDDLLAKIHDKLATDYLRARKPADELAAIVDERGHCNLRDRTQLPKSLRALVRSSDNGDRGQLPIVFPLKGQRVVLWVSVTTLTPGGEG